MRSRRRPSADFYPRSPCGERQDQNCASSSGPLFLSTLSLRRATRRSSKTGRHFPYFYPRSPCGERHVRITHNPGPRYFYPRSPCGERPGGKIQDPRQVLFLSTLSLRRATVRCLEARAPNGDFYPRSPCGERLCRHRSGEMPIYDFYPRSPCGERPRVQDYGGSLKKYFYPRSPCGERRSPWHQRQHQHRISIHALLAESDGTKLTVADVYKISIHALLAESDCPRVAIENPTPIFLSTLSLRRATRTKTEPALRGPYFYPRSPCGERPQCRTLASGTYGFLSTLSLRRATFSMLLVGKVQPISIHALLAESDSLTLSVSSIKRIFLSTLSLRRATCIYDEFIPEKHISIHALLAESD